MFSYSAYGIFWIPAGSCPQTHTAHATTRHAERNRWICRRTARARRHPRSYSSTRRDASHESSNPRTALPNQSSLRLAILNDPRRAVPSVGPVGPNPFVLADHARLWCVPSRCVRGGTCQCHLRQRRPCAPGHPAPPSGCARPGGRRSGSAGASPRGARPRACP